MSEDYLIHEIEYNGELEAKVSRLTAEVAALKERSEKAEAACSEMRNALQESFGCCSGDQLGRGHSDRCSKGKALKSYCGQSLLDELARLRKELALLRDGLI